MCLRSLILCGFCMHLRFSISIISLLLNAFVLLSLFNRTHTSSSMWQNNKARIHANEFKAQFTSRNPSLIVFLLLFNGKSQNISIMVNGYMHWLKSLKVSLSKLYDECCISIIFQSIHSL